MEAGGGTGDGEPAAHVGPPSCTRRLPLRSCATGAPRDGSPPAAPRAVVGRGPTPPAQAVPAQRALHRRIQGIGMPGGWGARCPRPDSIVVPLLHGRAPTTAAPATPPMQRSLALAGLAAVGLSLSGCTSAGTAVFDTFTRVVGPPAPSDPPQRLAGPLPNAEGVVVIRLEHLSPSLAEYAGDARYDFLEAVQYEWIDVESFDALAFSSAVHSANLIQIRHTLAAYREGDLSISEDLPFLLAMSSHAVQTLPRLLGDARSARERGRALNPRAVPVAQWGSALRSLNQSLGNLRRVLSSASAVADATEGYADLYADLCAAMGEEDCPADVQGG
jgi:hypothetical protein